MAPRKVGRSRSTKDLKVGVDRKGYPMVRFKRLSAPPKSNAPMDEFRAWLRPSRVRDQFAGADEVVRVPRSQYAHLQIVETPRGYRLMTPEKARQSGYHHWPFAPKVPRTKAAQEEAFDEWAALFRPQEKAAPPKRTKKAPAKKGKK